MKKILFVMAMPFLFTACESDESYQTISAEAMVTDVTFNDTIALGESIDINLTYAILNSCGEYLETDVTSNANSYLIRPFVKYSYTSSKPCIEVVTYGEETVKLKPEAKGKYILYFKKNNSGYTADTLTVK